MTARHRLPDRRRTEVVKFEHDGQSYFASIGFYDDGRIGEVFLNCKKLSTPLDIAARDAAIAISFALQHGSDISTMRRAFTRDASGRPEGVLGALLDALADGSIQHVGEAA